MAFLWHKINDYIVTYAISIVEQAILHKTDLPNKIIKLTTGPGGPLSPWFPFGPVDPVVPLCPLYPLGPRGPFNPGTPRSPFEPCLQKKN